MAPGAFAIVGMRSWGVVSLSWTQSAYAMGEEEVVAKYVVGDTHAGVVVPPLSRYHIVSRTGQRKFLRFLSACIHSADCRGLTVNEVWCVRPSFARRLESRKSLLERTLKWSIRSIHTQFNERTQLLIQFIPIYNHKTQNCYRMYTKGEGIW